MISHLLAMGQLPAPIRKICSIAVRIDVIDLQQALFHQRLGDFGELAFIAFDVVAKEALWVCSVGVAHHVTGNGRGKSGDEVATVYSHRSRLGVHPTLPSAAAGLIRN
jgi:hypothetical protein